MVARGLESIAIVRATGASGAEAASTPIAAQPRRAELGAGYFEACQVPPSEPHWFLPDHLPAPVRPSTRPLTRPLSG